MKHYLGGIISLVAGAFVSLSYAQAGTIDVELTVRPSDRVLIDYVMVEYECPMSTRKRERLDNSLSLSRPYLYDYIYSPFIGITGDCYVEMHGYCSTPHIPFSPFGSFLCLKAAGTTGLYSKFSVKKTIKEIGADGRGDTINPDVADRYGSIFP